MEKFFVFGEKGVAKLKSPCYNTACAWPGTSLSLSDTCLSGLGLYCAGSTLGCRQAVRHQTLTLAFVGSNPAIPANDPLAQLAEQLPFKQWVWSSNLQRVTTKHPRNKPFLGCFAVFYKLFRTEKFLRSDSVTNLLLTAMLPSFCVSALMSSILRCV